MSKIHNQEFLKVLEKLKTFNTSLAQVLDRRFYSFSTEYQVIWQHNNTRLLKFKSDNKYSCSKVSPILLIPSLINHGYILDIMSEYSFVEILSNKFSCYLIDWGEPVLEEANYKFEDYYRNKVAKILDFIHKEHEQKIDIIGYCLGGIVSILSAILNVERVNRLVLLACPWDFSCYRDKILIMKSFIDQLINTQQLISSHFIRNFFMSFMPIEEIYNKFVTFGSLALDSPKRELFLRVEKWAVHNLFISNGIIREIINDFVLRNILICGDWIVCGKKINLNTIEKKCFVVLGKSDVVVPYISSEVLIKQSNSCYPILLSSGHVGILIGREAKKWQHKLVSWLSS
ncbi:MAG: hypothetical protein HRU36_00055 [Rickettsiales bacterium]|nr:hypothetical protein [Rickettsiales bacterium]